MSLAIVLQVWNGDAWLGLRLMRLICSIEREQRADIEFILAARRETNHDVIRDIVAAAKTKFKSTHIIQGKRFGIGWPVSPNDLWQETMMRVHGLASSGKLAASGVLTFEPDCIPLRPDWLDALSRGWAEAEGEGKECLGHAHVFAGEDEARHINGNAIFACNLLKLHPEMSGCDARYGWDAYHGALLLRIGKDTPLICQRYRIQNISREDVEAIRKDGQIPALFHGIKQTDGLQAIEAMIADGTFFQNRNG